MSDPLVSVVLPVFNGARELPQQLAALSAQDYTGRWEVVVADNGSTDATFSIAAEHKDLLPNMRVVDVSMRRGGAAACNQGIEAAAGDLIALCDHDDVVAPDWLSSLVEAAQTADLVVGSFVLFSDDGEIDISTASGDPKGSLDFLPYGLSSNMLMRRDLHVALQGFDESFSAAYDLDLCFRAQISGARFQNVPGALVRKRRREDARGAFQQHRTYGRHDVRLYEKHRTAGLRPRPELAVKTWAWILLNLALAARSHAVRRRWLRVAGHAVGRLEGSLRARVFFP